MHGSAYLSWLLRSALVALLSAAVGALVCVADGSPGALGFAVRGAPVIWVALGFPLCGLTLLRFAREADRLDRCHAGTAALAAALQSLYSVAHELPAVGEGVEAAPYVRAAAKELLRSAARLEAPRLAALPAHCKAEEEYVQRLQAAHSPLDLLLNLVEAKLLAAAYSRDVLRVSIRASVSEVRQHCAVVLRARVVRHKTGRSAFLGGRGAFEPQPHRALILLLVVLYCGTLVSPILQASALSCPAAVGVAAFVALVWGAFAEFQSVRWVNSKRAASDMFADITLPPPLALAPLRAAASPLEALLASQRGREQQDQQQQGAAHVSPPRSCLRSSTRSAGFAVPPPGPPTLKASPRRPAGAFPAPPAEATPREPLRPAPLREETSLHGSSRVSVFGQGPHQYQQYVASPSDFASQRQASNSPYGLGEERGSDVPREGDDATTWTSQDSDANPADTLYHRSIAAIAGTWRCCSGSGDLVFTVSQHGIFEAGHEEGFVTVQHRPTPAEPVGRYRVRLEETLMRITIAETDELEGRACALSIDIHDVNSNYGATLRAERCAAPYRPSHDSSAALREEDRPFLTASTHTLEVPRGLSFATPTQSDVGITTHTGMPVSPLSDIGTDHDTAAVHIRANLSIDFTPVGAADVEAHGGVHRHHSHEGGRAVDPDMAAPVGGQGAEGGEGVEQEQDGAGRALQSLSPNMGASKAEKPVNPLVHRGLSILRTDDAVIGAHGIIGAGSAGLLSGAGPEAPDMASDRLSDTVPSLAHVSLAGLLDAEGDPACASRASNVFQDPTYVTFPDAL